MSKPSRSRPSAKPRGFVGLWPRKSRLKFLPSETKARSPWPTSAARRSICRTLAEAFPGDPVIAEEDSADLRLPANEALLEQVLRHVRSARPATDGEAAVAIDASDVCRWIDHGGSGEFSPRFWTLDPIDGTKGFLRGEQYAVALALIVDGRVVVAALACPNLPARLGKRTGRTRCDLSCRCGSGCSARLARPRRRLCTDARAVDRQSLRPGADARFCESVESGHSAQADAAAVAARLGIITPPRRMDSQAKYAVVARGEADIYLRLPTRADYREKIWDHAAGSLIVAEAGGSRDRHRRPAARISITGGSWRPTGE